MKLKFKINYRTVWGQHLCIVGNIPELGEDIRAKALDMNHEGNGVWTAEISVGEAKRISYHSRKVSWNTKPTCPNPRFPKQARFCNCR